MLTPMSEAMQNENIALVAYPARVNCSIQIRPAPRSRPWLDVRPASAGKHCLPLLIANQSGWELINPQTFVVTWSGDGSRESVSIEGSAGRYTGPAHSGFGAGILSFTVPFLFRTPPRWNLLVRGPANRPKDGISALEGVVETDWSVATFTMNWQLTRPGVSVRFEEGEPFCMVVPQPRGLVEQFKPELRDISSDPATKAATKQFIESRRDDHRARFLGENGFADMPPFNRQYFRGRYPHDNRAVEHQTRLVVPEFADRSSECPSTNPPGIDKQQT